MFLQFIIQNQEVMKKITQEKSKVQHIQSIKKKMCKTLISSSLQGKRKIHQKDSYKTFAAPQRESRALSWRFLSALQGRSWSFPSQSVYVLSTCKRRPMGCVGHSNCMMTRWTLPHPKRPKDENPKKRGVLGTLQPYQHDIPQTSRGCHWLRCVLSGL